MNKKLTTRLLIAALLVGFISGYYLSTQTRIGSNNQSGPKLVKVFFGGELPDNWSFAYNAEPYFARFSDTDESSNIFVAGTPRKQNAHNFPGNVHSGICISSWGTCDGNDLQIRGFDGRDVEKIVDGNIKLLSSCKDRIIPAHDDELEDIIICDTFDEITVDEKEGYVITENSGKYAGARTIYVWWQPLKNSNGQTGFSDGYNPQENVGMIIVVQAGHDAEINHFLETIDFEFYDDY